MKINVDLHCHSTVSDGVLTPEEVAQRAHANGVKLWALTDHDDISGLPAAAATAAALGVNFIPGIEISATWCKQTVHILGLNFDAKNKALNDGLTSIRLGRARRALQISERLEAMGVEGSYEGALRYASNPALVSRTHFARFLVNEGYCKTMQEVFDKYLADNKPGNVPMHWCTVGQAVGWIVGAGGRAAIAHPGRYDYTVTQFDALFDEFKQQGGAAIEVVTGSHTVDQYDKYGRIARHYGFLASCGSDFHSPTESRLDLGQLPPLPAGVTPIWHDWI